MRILIAGDFVPCLRVAAQIESGDYTCLDEVKPIIQSSDYSIVNFESPVVTREANPIEKTGPNLKCTERAMECIANAGFKCVTLANNHFRDYGQIGVEDTIDACAKYNIDHVGGGLNNKDAERILYKNINGTLLAIINCCEHEWSIATSSRGGSNPLDIVTVCHAIQESKKNADFVLVIVHGGTELYNLPSPRMKKIYRFFIEHGADAIVNHHQHCYSGYEVYNRKPIFYGLGNFCFDKSDALEEPLWENGYMVELDFSDVVSFKLYPYNQCDKNNASVQLTNDAVLFEKNIKDINEIIANDELLGDHFESIAWRGLETAKYILEPYSSLFMRRLHAKRLVPSFVTDERIKLLYAYLQCESHRDMLLYGMGKIY